MRFIKALWKTIRELDKEIQILIVASICAVLFIIGGICQSVILTIVFGLMFCVLELKICWIMIKEDFQKFVTRVKENMNT